MAVSLDDDFDHFPVVRDPKNFDQKSGDWLERLIFNNRFLIMVACLLTVLFLGYHAFHLKVNANYERMIPASHPYIQNYLANKGDIKWGNNALRVVVENTSGDIYDPEYLEVLRKVNDTFSLMRGVDRTWIKSIWMPIIRWSEVTEEGWNSGPVMPDNFQGTPAEIEQLKANIAKTQLIGSYISNDQRSATVHVPLLDRYADTYEPLDYGDLSREIEKTVRSLETDKIKIHITGFGKLVGDLIDGLVQVIFFFGVSALIASLMIYAYTRCIRSTVVLVLIAEAGVISLLGMMQLLGYELDPYSILVPFLIFAIGLSHGAQKMNGIMLDVGRGTHKYVAARYTFRRLFMAGLTALLTNVVGFAVLMIIDIPVIKDLAFTTSLGVLTLILTKLVLIPVVLSYTGVSPKAAARALRESEGKTSTGWMARVFAFLPRFAERRWAVAASVCSLVIFAAAFVVSTHIKVGDLDAGAPELHQDSRYNKDVKFIANNFGMSSDIFAVMVKTDVENCDKYATLIETGRLGWALEEVPGVQGVNSMYTQVSRYVGGLNEGNPKLTTIYDQPNAIGTAVQNMLSDASDLFNSKCSLSSVMAYLTDHKAETLSHALKTVEDFAAEHNQPGLQFLPVAGTAGIEAVTNIVVKESFYRMHFVLYGAVVLLCYITFRSWRAVIVALVPLLITSILCEAIMVFMGIGIKVATLPVIALGVGVGVDYALYLLSIQLALQRRGVPLADAYKSALDFTGKVVALVGFTMAAGVVTWAWSPIKFQADMGILLTFMFLWNMLGALVLIPALSHFLLRKVK